MSASESIRSRESTEAVQFDADVLFSRFYGEQEPSKFSLYYSEDFDGGLADMVTQAGVDIETEVFGEFFDNNQRELEEVYGTFAESSSFMLVVDNENNRPAGVMRIIKNSEAGQISLKDAAEEPWSLSQDDIDQAAGDPDGVWDIATIAVSRHYRGERESFVPRSALFSGLFNLSIHDPEVESWVAVLDDHTLVLLNNVGIPFGSIADAKPEPYHGSSASTPVICSVEAAGRGVKALDENLYDYLAHGKGLDEAVNLPYSNWANKTH